MAPPRPLILVVDDDPAVLGGLTFALESHQFDVRACASARAARQAGPEAADCMIIDQQLPDMSGLELLRLLRDDGVTAPAVLITTAPSPILQRQAELEGVEIISKPLLTDALYRAVQRLCSATTDREAPRSQVRPAS